MGFWGVPKGRGGSSKLNNSTEFIHFKEHWSTTNFSPWYCWWFRNPASTSWGNGSSSHHLRRVFYDHPINSSMAWNSSFQPFWLDDHPMITLRRTIKRTCEGLVIKVNKNNNSRRCGFWDNQKWQGVILERTNRKQCKMMRWCFFAKVSILGFEWFWAHLI